jgi:hypothetical protein
MTDLRKAAEEQAVHPVVHLWDCICNWAEIIANDGKDANLTPPDWLFDAVIAATTPPKREWVGLSNVDKVNIRGMWVLRGRFEECLEAIEAKLKEKNT